jgi:alpha-amylase/alpha-mannosidase (GH57 family)
MAHTYICFVWHMHQPFYKDLVTGEYQLPWTRMHALKDYYGMVQVLEEFPGVHQTFNLVPSMIAQIEDYAEGTARDPFLRCALKPAEELTADEQSFVLKYFFQANASRMIYRYPRFGELYDLWRASEGNMEKARRAFHAQAFRDLQVLSQLAWFDEEFQAKDPEVRALFAKARNYTLRDQELVGRKQREICGRVLPVYREFAKRGQVELSVTPFYHPILPLLCDSGIASVSHPNVPLPRRFRYPQDAREQIARARAFAREKFGYCPPGMWPSEGSVSDETLRIAAEEGVEWMATDNGVLGATILRTAGVEETCRPYVWRQGGREMKLIFRDHYLSDLIGFVYSKMEAEQAANHFLDRVRENCRSITAGGRDALVPVILDGENAWEHYDRNGREFLRHLYAKISADPTVSAVTVTEALNRLPCTELTRIHPGSWINANFDIWIGAEEDNRAWNLLLDARQAYDRVTRSTQGTSLPEERRRLAYEELLIAEGSDWCWWYGPEHHSENRPEFDKLFRGHLAHVYRLLGEAPPEELSRPILRVAVAAFHQPPTGAITPRLDGEVSSYFEWLGAGIYRPDLRQGSMHGQEFVLREFQYGSDGTVVYLRVDFHETHRGAMAGTEIRISAESGGKDLEVRGLLTSQGAEITDGDTTRAYAHCVYQRIFELALDLKLAGLNPERELRLQLSVWRDGLPVDAVPAQGWIEFIPAQPGD